MLRNWLVVYTKPRHEKKSASVLVSKGIEIFLPLKTELKQWSDRKKWVERPLFPGYLFVNITELEYLDVLNSAGIVRFIFFNGKPAIVREKTIKELKLVLNTPDLHIETIDLELNLGEIVSIKKGPFKGLEGRLIQFKGKNRISIEIECMQKAVLVEIDKSYLN